MNGLVGTVGREWQGLYAKLSAGGICSAMNQRSDLSVLAAMKAEYSLVHFGVIMKRISKYTFLIFIKMLKQKKATGHLNFISFKKY